ncbi:MAG: glycine dehydrogenase (aminomethyl-transferring) [Actinobacteria bacterium]|nr:glycine dehydrogenase (aminomethyl-transferring) [Actinomycetota bacterium]NBQ66209.1 glycine dehydrogenase (aminomethyl-transferring) [Actinomycetota bacterium]NCZ72191.1 glycine dehydrogenase (aminomethyl-transferring) [Actinomycetota bacterium]NDE26519.1 glycine dehydrogenase (aminomethyl-transferring) [Actinomycetota bacterium]NDE36426.1 glycine dehydrogenase (aminomethyl-transferring) [Actinomycetota bacterium]
MARQEFSDRHIGPSSDEISTMLLELGYSDLESFTQAVLPDSIKLTSKFGPLLPKPISEIEVIAELRNLAAENHKMESLIGLGYYASVTPPVVLRNVLENPAWYTAYTPYQPEISQGRLEALFTFQTMVSDLTGLPICNASMLDEPTAAAEAMTLARRSTKLGDEAKFVIDSRVHPQTQAVVMTRAKPLRITCEVLDLSSGVDLSHCFGVLLQYPDTFGSLNDFSEVIAKAHSGGALVIMASDLLALTLIKSPGEWGADIAVGSAQRFGVPMGFGGPHAGFLAVREGLERSLPGRLVGQSIDSHGNPALRLALQTREQHIRRDKATSNICTAQVLLAVISAFYGAWHGPNGLKEIAVRTHQLARKLAGCLKESGFELYSANFFDTVSFLASNSEALIDAALKAGINVRKISGGVSVAFDEVSTSATVERLIRAWGLKQSSSESYGSIASIRSTSYMQHPVFNSYHSETAMLRYIRTLSDRDLALDRTMIPLGSCTMKLNATTEMEAITWPEFADLHPFAPSNQSAGTRKIVSELSRWLIDITGYDAVSLQPNAGSQGEFAGLLAIRNYLDSLGQSQRDICLIPSSAHGTNAASAVMAGMRVVVIACDEAGNVSMEDLKAKIAEYGENLAALMVTYPSTHGVFESEISQICALIHDAGGQVYVDGANLNALVGLAQPGKFGADVSHLNLHKTFCIPHGGGGPGVGPVIAKKHLAPFLPNHPLDSSAGPLTGPGPISGAPFGSALILPISWAYIRMMGAEGLTKATQVAILSANYIAKKLASDYPTLYTGKNNLIAHECIIDIREITKRSGVSVDDIAKRLMDYGFHAPTMSFPVPGTLMIEPTESEDITEIDRFIAALRSIAKEIRAVESGEISLENSPLRNAPHTVEALVSDSWDKPYSRQEAALPLGSEIGIQRRGKYWPTVGRVDGAHGDRNLVCACEPIESIAIN